MLQIGAESKKLALYSKHQDNCKLPAYRKFKHLLKYWLHTKRRRSEHEQTGAVGNLHTFFPMSMSYYSYSCTTHVCILLCAALCATQVLINILTLTKQEAAHCLWASLFQNCNFQVYAEQNQFKLIHISKMAVTKTCIWLDCHVYHVIKSYSK